MDLTSGGKVDSFGPDTQGRITLTMTSRNAEVGHAVYVEQDEAVTLAERLLELAGAKLVLPDEVGLARQALAEALTKLRAFGYEGDAFEVESKYGFVYQAPEPFVTRVPS